MTPEEARNLHLAVRLHFSQRNYDLHKFRGKINAKNLKEPSPLYAVLANTFNIEDELRGLFIANCVAGHCHDFVDWFLGAEAKRIWLEWSKRVDGLSEHIRKETKNIAALSDGRTLKQLLEPPGGTSYPPLLDFYYRGLIEIETVIVYLRLFGYRRRWDEEIGEPYIWPSTSLMMTKYSSLLSIDLNKMAATVKEAYKPQNRHIPNPPPKLPKRSDPNVLSDSEWDNLIASIT